MLRVEQTACFLLTFRGIFSGWNSTTSTDQIIQEHHATILCPSNRDRMIRALVILSAIIVSATSARAADPIAGPATVIDGDTIEIAGQRIGLHGIDAPESKQTCLLIDKPYNCGKQSADALASVIKIMLSIANPKAGILTTG